VFAADQPDQFRHVERVAPGAIHQGGNDVTVRRSGGQALQERGDIRRGEGADRHPLTARVAEQLPERLAQSPGRLGVADCEEQQRGHPVQVAGEQLQQGQRGVVGGVQVIDDREQGGVGGRLAERSGHGLVGAKLADAVLLVSGEVTVQALPGRLHDRTGRERVKYLAPWPVGGRGGGVRAPAPGGRDAVGGGQPRCLFGEGGLARAGLADQDDRAAATGCDLPEPAAKMGQLAVAADQGRASRSRRGVRCGRRRPGVPWGGHSCLADSCCPPGRPVQR